MKDLAEVESMDILGKRPNRSTPDYDSLISHSWWLGNHQMAAGIDDFPRTIVLKAWPGRAVQMRQW